MSKLTGGPHMGVVRSWIKWRFNNGDQVDWGTQTLLTTGRSFTVCELETLAQEIRDAVLDEVITTKQLDRVASEMVKKDSQTITVTFDHHRVQCQVGSCTSPEYLGLEGGLRWLYFKLKEILKNE